MLLTQQSQEILLETKRNNATLVARSNGKTTITRRFEGGETFKYKTEQIEYEAPKFFKSFYRKECLIKKGIKEKASRILQAASYMNLTTKERYISISGFKPVLF